MANPTNQCESAMFFIVPKFALAAVSWLNYSPPTPVSSI
jgi:hypothetical protein